MNRWKLACMILLALSVSLAFGFVSAYLRSRETDAALDAYIAEDAKRKHFEPGKFVEPKIPDAPAGAKRLFHAEGSVFVPPTPRPTEPAVEVELGRMVEPAVELLPVVDARGCTLDDVGVRMRCSFDGIASPKRPLGRLYVSGRLEGFGQIREIPEVAAADVELAVAPWLNPATWHADLFVGIAAGDRIGYEFGAGWTGRSRVGPYVLAEYQTAEAGSLVYDPSTEGYLTAGALPATWRVHAGIRIRIK